MTLKPCPWCGGQAQQLAFSAVIFCPKCAGRPIVGEKESADRWNTRPIEDALREALQDIVDIIAAEQLMPESISYLKQARAALKGDHE